MGGRLERGACWWLGVVSLRYISDDGTGIDRAFGGTGEFPMNGEGDGVWRSLRKFALAQPGVLDALTRCYAYWIALTDCEGLSRPVHPKRPSFQAPQRRKC
jgi:hypothetical protein